MKAVILAGGLGTRLSEETRFLPKPLVEIGGKPILWHIMKIYSAYGINDFIICCGYKGYLIKQFFCDYWLSMSDITIDIATNAVNVDHNYSEPWKVTLADTGEQTMTGGRLKRVADYIGRETFCLTYGDGLSDVNLRELIEFHQQQKALATVTAIQRASRFGVLGIAGGKVSSFTEKPNDVDIWLNGGFFVLEPAVFEYIDGDLTAWEAEPLRRLAQNGELAAYRHTGFWQSMDMLRDKVKLEELWESGQAPWKVW